MIHGRIDRDRDAIETTLARGLEAVATQRRLLGRGSETHAELPIDDRPVLVIGTHFATPTAGRVVRDGEVYRLDY